MVKANGRLSMLAGFVVAVALLLAAGLILVMGETAEARTDVPVAVAAVTPTPEPEAKTAQDKAQEDGRPEGWTEESHSNDVDPNYDVVFPAGEVQVLTITIAAEQWQAMQADLTELLGEQGTGGAIDRGFAGGEPPEGMFVPGMPITGAVPMTGTFVVTGVMMGEAIPVPEGMQAPEGMPVFPGMGERPGAPGDFVLRGDGPGGFGGGDMVGGTPAWVTATITFGGQTWTNVGVRYKGNSSLTSGWRSGTLALPFKLDFDEFEDTYPEIDDQRFFGFKQLSLSNNFSDAAFMRDSLTYDVLEEAGLPAMQSAAYQIVLDYGEGPVNLGLYTVIEVVDDTGVDAYFGSDDGNIYEGDGSAASLAEGTFESIPDDFQKENNEDEADWSDIETLYEVLHSEQRTEDPEAWRAELEAVFDVDSFLEWLGISAAIGHWDAYGAMSHNYYLYNDPDTGRLTWISWDHNMAFQSGGMAGAARVRNFPAATSPISATAAITAADESTAVFDVVIPVGQGDDQVFEVRGGPGRGVSLDKADVSDNWPLIRFLLDDPVYYARYVELLEGNAAGVLDPAGLSERIEAYAEVLGPYAAEQTSQEEFDQAVQSLIDFVETRATEVETFLADQE